MKLEEQNESKLKSSVTPTNDTTVNRPHTNHLFSLTVPPIIVEHFNTNHHIPEAVNQPLNYETWNELFTSINYVLNSISQENICQEEETNIKQLADILHHLIIMPNSKFEKRAKFHEVYKQLRLEQTRINELEREKRNLKVALGRNLSQIIENYEQNVANIVQELKESVSHCAGLQIENQELKDKLAFSTQNNKFSPNQNDLEGHIAQQLRKMTSLLNQVQITNQNQHVL